MPPFNPKSVKSLVEPIEFILNEKTYTVGAMTAERVAKVRAASESAGKDAGMLVPEQLAAFTDAEPSEFADADLRETTAILSYINARIESGLEEGRKKAQGSR